MVDQDPYAAVQFSANVLEATLKAYLSYKNIEFSTTDGLLELWKKASSAMGMRAGDLESKDLKKIVSVMNSIVDGMAHLRNNKSSAHGRTNEQVKNFTILPRHARLSINAAHTVSAYVLDVMD
ncbi:abortive infection family protein [Brevundimonas sp.]|uniref:abortive infection family protein n=1 Tax=Brevundimonas sp. TaxID=1871086 RepID=UPI002897133E|nr:abortive infection family protein [Brevundimonas sp.]